ncbi:DUF3050 domain-containing protein [Flavobacterium sp. xlx-214]|uniref:DUF3050 domain-containing protein n=1 Tax=unclassified Flavobacterium TaxID=196869 RepID=UPI0013D7CA42|nr:MULTISPECIES: DUF3050 domain-containing protein [unclassified Flavobacterium]MBA5792876.1 DUF3050 domain-containing protein [Flavobacterium sp. xlx-221]QMI84790.1 DUF3050 domain-containing protein [Flavobacterium sp. xlx-214]
MQHINHINQSINVYKQQLLQHTLYKKIHTINDLKHFLEGHVYAVWDFMSLLKALQSKLTCTTSPWFASPNPEVRYLINEIVLAEESDVTLYGTRLSHFEMYLQAMEKCEANTLAVSHFLNEVQAKGIFNAINESTLHDNIKDFLTFTFETIENGKSHEIAAAFTFGREDLIPNMFTQILNEFKISFPLVDLSELVYYFERHIELDADEHGPMAFEMISYLCGEDAEKWNEVEEISKKALEKRIKLWDAIEELIEQ